MRYRYLRFPEGKFKAVTFSYDDGVKADIRLAEIFDRYGMKGTFNINSAFFGNPGKNARRLNAAEIKRELIDKGQEIAIHGARHIASGSAAPVLCTSDALECRVELEREFDTIIRGMAYPDSGIRFSNNGNNFEIVKSILESVGIVYSRTLSGDNDSFLLPTEWFAWMPTAHHNNPQIFDWIEKFNNMGRDIKNASGFPRLFYLWGHTYEFDRDNNWDRIEKILDELSGKEDTWYATNIEIYDYVKAYDSLVFSADNNMVYNPTLIKVWFFADGKIYSVNPGQTLVVDM